LVTDDRLGIAGVNSRKAKDFFASGANIHGEDWVRCFSCDGTEFRKVGEAQFGRITLICMSCGRTLTKQPSDVTIEKNGIVRLNPHRNYIKI
jgi:hypothetical protein